MLDYTDFEIQTHDKGVLITVSIDDYDSMPDNELIFSIIKKVDLKNLYNALTSENICLLTGNDHSLIIRIKDEKLYLCVQNNYTDIACVFTSETDDLLADMIEVLGEIIDSK